MSSMSLKKLIVAIIAIVTLAVVDLMGLAVIGGFKDTGLVDNTTAGQFETGLGFFGLFVGVLAIAVIGKTIIDFFRETGKGDLKGLVPAVVAIVTMAIVDLMGLAIISGFKDTGLVDNTTAGQFETGLAVFGLFVGVMAIAIVGKVVIALFKKS